MRVSPALTPAIDPTVSPATSSQPVDDWIELTIGAADRISWSPDSTHVMVPRRAPFGVAVFGTDGALVRAFDGYDEGVWLDAERLVLSKRLRNEDGSSALTRSGRYRSVSYVALLDSGEVRELEVDLGAAISNGKGALAVDGCGSCRFVDSETRIWTLKGGLSKPIVGVALAWSLDGRRLMVEHPVQPGPTGRRWPEILEWPGLERIWADRDSSGVLVDPAWLRVVEYEDGLGPPGDGVTVAIISIESGDRNSFSSEASGVAAFDDAGRLVIVDYDSKDAYQHELGGTLVNVWPRVGDHVTASADGSTLAFWYFDQFPQDPESRKISLLREDRMGQIVAPEPFSVGFGATQLSPDGRFVVISVLLSRGSRLLLSPVD